MALDLVTLLRGVAVRHEPERDAAPPEALEALERVGKEAHRRAPAGGEVARDRSRHARGLDA